MRTASHPHRSRYDARELLGHPVFALEEAKRVGTIAGLLIDPATSTLCGVRVQDRVQRIHYLAFSDFLDLEPDAAIIRSAGVLLHELPPDLRGKCDAHLCGRAVRTESGTDLGRIVGFEVDVRTGHIECYRCAPETNVWGVWGRWFGWCAPSPLTIPLDHVVAITDAAVIVKQGAGAIRRLSS